MTSTDMQPDRADGIVSRSIGGWHRAWDFVLATDLDGTFLGGAQESRTALYAWIEAHRSRLGLIFVTGRDPQFIETLCADHAVPWPDYVIGDVGTTIALVDDRKISPIAALEGEIASIWDDAGRHVREQLDGAPGLTLQPTPFRHRVSYDFDPQAYDGRAEAIVCAMGHDVLISDDRFFDVLPKGVSKGPSLLRLIDHLKIESDQVLVAGDTLNDLSMFHTGLAGAVVAEAEPALLEATADIDKARHCSAPGAAGIAEAIAAFGLFDPAPPSIET